MQEFATWLRGLRQHVEQTQAQFADGVGVHRTTIARWETAVLYPDFHTRIRLNELAREAGYRPVPPKR
jgi:DNA-binding XRE family transcriptional regulator